MRYLAYVALSLICFVYGLWSILMVASGVHMIREAWRNRSPQEDEPPIPVTPDWMTIDGHAYGIDELSDLIVKQKRRIVLLQHKVTILEAMRRHDQ